MERLRVKFVDFWVDMDKMEDNYFGQLLSAHFEIEFSETPDVVFYSCFGNEHLKYSCTRIFFSTENFRPNFQEADYVISFDYLNDPRHLRFPLWASYYLSYKKNGLVTSGMTIDDRFRDWSSKEKFCCIVVSNEKATERIDFYKQLNKIRRVDSAGEWNNTIGTQIEPGTYGKFRFLKDYRFVISFENSSYPGYTTEKLVEPILANCIPVYWGDPVVAKEFNVNRFIHVNGMDYSSAIETILEIESNRHNAKRILEEPMFAGDADPICLRQGYLEETLLKWIKNAKTKGYRGIGAQTSQRLKYYTLLCKKGLQNIKMRTFRKSRLENTEI
jgi:alpha(1,3/1,4) fucosyltransferase